VVLTEEDSVVVPVAPLAHVAGGWLFKRLRLCWRTPGCCHKKAFQSQFWKPRKLCISTQVWTS